MSEPIQTGRGPGKPGVLMPAPTAWPFAMAMGTALGFTGLLTDVSVSVLGGILWIFGAVGWFRQVLPHEKHESIPIPPEQPARVLPPREVLRMPVAQQVQRAWLPLKIYPVSAGVKGGLAGGVAMAILAALYGVIFYHSVWYPINLLAGSLYSAASTPTVEEMQHFQMGWFLFALGMHVTMCLLVGLLYGATLPLLPRSPILLGGIIGPLLWTGLLYHIIGYVNPLLDARINWWWFAASQVAFGVVAGLVVKRQNRVWTSENLPLAMRAGIEAPGLMEEREDEDKRWLRFAPSAMTLASLLLLAGCNLPGKPTTASIVKRPTDILDPVVLYQQNCAGCHGAEGKLGPAPPIGDPLYLAIADDNTLRSTIAKGRPGTAMSAFAQSEGGMLTTQQINAIVQGMRQRWANPQVLQGGTAPPYAAAAAGNAQQGAATFATFCASCHGEGGKGSTKVGSIVNPSYLSLITDQGLRTIVIIGRPDFDAPDWRNDVPGHPMSNQDISDVVAWLAAQRPADAVTASAAAMPSPALSSTTSAPGGQH